MYNKKFKIIRQEEVVSGHLLLCLKAPEISSKAVPGQFLHIRCADLQDPLLRRPISIHDVDREQGFVFILYKVIGKGTALLASKKPGDFVDVIGPLGRGYSLPVGRVKTAVIGGGMGFAPLLFLLRELKSIYQKETEKVSVYLGSATVDFLLGMEQVKALGFSLNTATDDGTTGFKGNVLELFTDAADKNDFERIYACGPLPMLKKLSDVVSPDSFVEVSVEERMACGVGACLSCACRVRGKDGKDSGYAHVCRDGPVFNLRNIIL